MSYSDNPFWSPPPQRRRTPAVAWLVLVVFVCAVAAGSWYAGRVWTRLTDTGRDPDAQSRPVVPRGELTGLEQTNIRVYKDSRVSVVHITTLAVRSDFYSRGAEVPEGTGSGFLWDENGHVVTNFHVIRNASSAKVTLSDHSTYTARYVGGAPDKDIAVLKIDAPREKLRPIAVGSSEDLQVGQLVYAIGNPYGFDQTLTTGIISAIGRELPVEKSRATLKNMIQTDAAINPGNSGGPLLDSAGRLIGINTAIYSRSGGSAGIGFAIPVDEVNHVVPQLIRQGAVVRPFTAGATAGREETPS